MNFAHSIDFTANEGVILLMHNVSCLKHSGAGINELSHKEKLRYEKIVSANDRALYLNQRIILRKILSTIIACDSSEISYNYKNNKPLLDNDIISDFNISHGADAFVVFVVRKGSCGVDIDFQRKIKYFAEIGQRFFTAKERQYINKHDDQEYAFFEIWSKKEAVVKMHASGMFADAKNYDVLAQNILYKGSISDITCCNIRLENGFMSFSYASNVKNIQFIVQDFASGDSIASFL
jgi:phosphopantetheinyl transferase